MATELCSQSLVRLYVGAHHRTIYTLEERLDQTLHSIVKLMVSQSLKCKGMRFTDWTVKVKTAILLYYRNVNSKTKHKHIQV